MSVLSLLIFRLVAGFEAREPEEVQVDAVAVRKDERAAGRGVAVYLCVRNTDTDAPSIRGPWSNRATDVDAAVVFVADPNPWWRLLYASEGPEIKHDAMAQDRAKKDDRTYSQSVRHKKIEIVNYCVLLVWNKNAKIVSWSR